MYKKNTQLQIDNMPLTFYKCRGIKGRKYFYFKNKEDNSLRIREDEFKKLLKNGAIILCN